MQRLLPSDPVSLSDRKMIVSASPCYTFPLLDAVQIVVATLFDERRASIVGKKLIHDQPTSSRSSLTQLHSNCKQGTHLASPYSSGLP